MARRKRPYITQFFNRDRLAFTALNKVGHVTQEDLRQCGLAESRIKNLVRDEHIEKVVYKNNGKVKECYKLTKLGRETALNLWGINNAYHAQNPIHDLAVAEKYFSLPQDSRETWRTETQIRTEFIERVYSMREEGKDAEASMYEDMLRKELISMPDCVYTDSMGNEVAFEVISNSYGNAELQSKERFIDITGYQYETTRV